MWEVVYDNPPMVDLHKLFAFMSEAIEFKNRLEMQGYVNIRIYPIF